MLISLINCSPKEYENDINRQQALENILNSHGSRKHLIVAKRKSMDDVISSSYYSACAKLYANSIIENYREHQILSKILDVIVEVDFNKAGIDTYEKGSQKIISVGYDYFEDFERCSPTVLLGENILDCRLYNKIAELYSKHMSDYPLYVNFDFQGGGGEQTKEHFSIRENQKRLCICIVDSDKTHPNGPEKNTSGQFNSTDKEVNSTTRALVIDACEVESIIPIKLLERVIVEGDYQNEFVDFIDEIKSFEEQNPGFRKYLDHKNGMTLKSALNLDNIYGTHWIDSLVKSKKYANAPCIESKECIECGECPKVPGFSGGILRKSVEKLDEQGPAWLKNNLDNSLIDVWEDIGNTLQTWGCVAGARPVRT